MTVAHLKRKRLRDSLFSPKPVVAVGAHDAMSARLIERYGFDAIWVSGFGVSTMAHAIPDLNLLTMTEALEAAVRMDAATNLPIVADCDNGFGGLSNVVRTIQEYERAGISGICVEDNTFPKRNSLYEGEAKRELVPIKEQARRIRAAKEAQETNNVVFIARVEALIAGYGIEEACRRADAYVEAGADAILIHSRDKTLREIDGFLSQWQGVGNVPLVAVPTLFPTFTIEQLYEKGFQMTILANQLMRSSVKAMEDTLQTLKETRYAGSVDPRIATINHIFDLVNTKGMIEGEDKLDQTSAASDTTQTASQPDSSREYHFQIIKPYTEFKREEIEQSVPDRFEAIVRRFPDHIAVKTKEHEFTYATLNQFANQVAHTILSQRGEGPEPIALLMEPGAPLLAAMIGVLKSGKFYVPIDPFYPVARMTYLLDDTQAGAVLTNYRNLSIALKLKKDATHIINVDELNITLPSEDLGLSVPPESMAYVIYTSGATGQPKGAMQNHRNVLHKAMEYTNSVHIAVDDRLVLLYSPSTSGAVRDIYSAILNGASIHPFNIRQNGLAGLAQWLINERITIYNSVATVFRQFVGTLTGNETFSNLRLIHIGSETIYRRDLELYKQYFSDDCIFIANFGATEVSPIRKFFANKETQIVGSTVPAGFAVDDTEVLLLGEDGKEVGFNCVGEIAVRSRFLSPGYWRKVEQTKTAFRPDPKGGEERIYLTGDLGQMRPDGCLMHLGRKDFQVKIRGHRVEVAEIETALLNLGTIKEAVVVARPDRSGAQRLVAYVIPSVKPAPTVSAFRQALEISLPDFMIPSAFEILDTLPLTTTGKVDRRVLPDPSYKRPLLENSYVAPQTPIERKLAAIWAEVLGVEQVGIHDNFLDLGGNSLSAIQVISRVINAFQVEVSLQSLFESSTLADMAVTILQSQAKGARQTEVLAMVEQLEKLSTEEAKALLAKEMKK